MKKLLAILLALGLVLVSVAALADVPAGAKDLIDADTADAEETPSIKKTYESNKTGVYPAETLKFTVTPKENTYPAITVGNNNTFAVNGSAAEYTIPVNVPAATAYKTLGAGMYHYTVKEIVPENKSQAVTYDTTKEFNVDVYAYYDNGDFKVQPVIYTGSTSEAKKDDEFKNTYEVGELVVTKEISGKLADPNKDFTIKITLNSTDTIANDLTVATTSTTAVTGDPTKGEKSYEFIATLKGGQTATISNIPTGVTYTVEETGVTVITAAQQIEKANDTNAYQVDYTDETGTISTTAANAKVKNTKDITIPEGISVDFVPYVLIIALAGIALVAMKARKKEN